MTSVDAALAWLLTLALWLEIAVSIEPAPVDALLMATLGVVLIAGKFSTARFEAAPVFALAAFVVANLASTFDPLDPPRAAMYLAITVYLVLSWVLFVGMFAFYGEALLGKALQAYSVAAILSALLGIIGYFHLSPFSETLLLNGRARGLFKDCNVYGPFFVPSALFALQRMLRGGLSWKQSSAQVTVLALSVGGVFLSFSRACWLNLITAVMVFFALKIARLATWRERSQLLVRLGAGVLTGGVCFALLLQVPEVNRMMSLRVSSNGLQNYDRVRFATHDLAYQAAAEHPLGIGPGQSEVIFVISTHSMYLRVLSENGALALAAFLAFISLTLKRSLVQAFRSTDTFVSELNLVAAACIAGHLVNSAVIDTVHWRHIWFIYALPWSAVSLRSVTRRQVRPAHGSWQGRHFQPVVE